MPSHGICEGSSILSKISSTIPVTQRSSEIRFVISIQSERGTIAAIDASEASNQLLALFE